MTKGLFATIQYKVDVDGINNHDYYFLQTFIRSLLFVQILAAQQSILIIRKRNTLDMFSTQKDGKPWIVKKRNVKKPKVSEYS